ncbi:MAG: 4Fe-4S double cluster binding domain-containing protein [Armatimonadota bacterium]
MSLQQILIDELKAAGADLVAFADMTDIPEDIRHNMPRAISIAAAFDPSVIASVKDGPTAEYDAECVRVKNLMNDLGDKCVSILKSEGYNALHNSFFGCGFSPETMSTPLPHKTAATRAGLGWIGKCCLLVTEEYGPAVSLMTVHTDAPLTVASPIDNSRCGDCMACAKACPVNAPSGKNREKGMARESFFDALTCYQKIEAGRREFGFELYICGMCIAACPYTQEYIKRSGQP